MSYFFTTQCANHSELIQYLCDNKTVTHNDIKQAMLKVDRADFTRLNPYLDGPQYIGHNATISSPAMHGYALNNLYLNLKPGMKALDIGCGSGYLVAAMACLVGEKGRVIGIEHIQELTKLSKRNIKKHHSHLLKTNTIEVICADGRKGYLKESPYDCIHVGAATQLKVVDILLKQLKNNGAMVLPVVIDGKTNEQIMRKYTKDENGKISFENIVPVRYIPLTDDKQQRESDAFQ